MRFVVQAINQAGGPADLIVMVIELISVDLTLCKTVLKLYVHLCFPTLWPGFNPKDDCNLGTIEQLYRTDCVQFLKL